MSQKARVGCGTMNECQDYSGLRPPGVRQYASATRHPRAALRRVSPGLRQPCPLVRYKALICCAASSRLVILVRVDSIFGPWMQSLFCRLSRGACLSPVWLTSYLRLSFQPPELQCTREALCGLCRHALPGDSVHRVPNGVFKRHSDTFGRFEFGELIQIYLLSFCSYDAVP